MSLGLVPLRGVGQQIGPDVVLDFDLRGFLLALRFLPRRLRRSSMLMKC